MSARQLLITLVPAAVMLLAVALAAIFMDLPVSVFVRDAAAVMGAHPLSGVLSTLGVLVWFASAAICLFAAGLVFHFAGRTRAFHFLLVSALLSGYLAFDDGFLFHEELALRYLGLEERYVVAALGAGVILYLVAFRSFILATRFLPLLLAFAFFAASMMLDAIPGVVPRGPGRWDYYVEDGSKWLGIACWCSYFAQTGHAAVVAASRSPAKAPKPAASSLPVRSGSPRARPLVAPGTRLQR